MDNHQEKEQSQKKNIVLGLASIGILAIVIALSYYAIKRIQSHQSTNTEAGQEIFETTPEVSSLAQGDCVQSAKKIYSEKDINIAVAEYKANAENCREIYFAMDDRLPQSKFRKEGMYGDFAIDLAHVLAESDKQAANEILNFAKTLKNWEFYLGPVSCDAHHVVDAYQESLNANEEKICIKKNEYQEKLVVALQTKNFSVLSKTLPNKEVVWLGQPESDVGCPEKLSNIISLLQKQLKNTFKVEESKTEMNESEDLLLSIRQGNEEKIIFVFRPNNECLEIQSVLIPTAETSE